MIRRRIPASNWCNSNARLAKLVRSHAKVLRTFEFVSTNEYVHLAKAIFRDISENRDL